MIKNIDHVTLVVKNLDKAVESYTKIRKLKPWSKGIICHATSRLAVLPTPSGARIELLEPNMTQPTPFKQFLNDRGEGVFGLCIFVDDFDERIEELKKEGIPVQVDTQSFLFPEHPFRMGWIPPQYAHGVWLEFVDYNALPSFEK
jgi:catechol 2,3-dioxygenase-like lactoylglutathione lyase family enzyme